MQHKQQSCFNFSDMSTCRQHNNRLCAECLWTLCGKLVSKMNLCDCCCKISGDMVTSIIIESQLIVQIPTDGFSNGDDVRGMAETAMRSGTITGVTTMIHDEECNIVLLFHVNVCGNPQKIFASIYDAYYYAFQLTAQTFVTNITRKAAAHQLEILNDVVAKSNVILKCENTFSHMNDIFSYVGQALNQAPQIK